MAAKFRDAAARARTGPAVGRADNPAGQMAEIPGQDDPGVQPTPDDGTRLSITRLLSHLAYEERELIDPLARYGFYDQQIR